MKINNLGSSGSIMNQFIAEIRDAEIQRDSLRFRRNLERMGQVFAYEISKTLDYATKEVETPLGTAEIPVLKNPPVLATILRAGLPLHGGLLNFFDMAGSAFISVYRKVYKDGHFKIHIDYTSSPNLDGEILILSDALLATGYSMELCYRELLTYGQPDHTHLVTVLSSTEGINHLKKNLATGQITLWTGAIDEEMTAQAYLVPGLGDAGDLAFGKKGD
ncbi:MAG TPA: uracil phosphoribosyltransferase [Bacteroidales bacterium]|nr:uracil phosphoribosyltransferase [Bacteroidales bacterium]HNS47796.1 uracil phosphoribosyltransferase [Bacteroidales bacterium]